MLWKHRNETSGQYISKSYEVSEMKGRILVPYYKEFTSCFIYSLGVYMWDRK
jgi:hypothetical protein